MNTRNTLARRSPSAMQIATHDTIACMIMADLVILAAGIAGEIPRADIYFAIALVWIMMAASTAIAVVRLNR